MKQEINTSISLDNTVDLSKYNNEWYRKQIGASRFKQACWYLVNATIFFHPIFVLSGFKIFLLRMFGAQIGKEVVIKPSVNIKYPWKLHIADHCWIGENVWIDNLADVIIGKNVCISQGAYLLTGNHDYRALHFDLVVKPIILEDGVWIGAKAVIAPGVTIASHAVLTAGSVATRNLLPYTVYQGNPAAPLRERNLSLKP
jgi:putative colanic acid biosynthesis acetyltransferase WcaF